MRVPHLFSPGGLFCSERLVGHRPHDQVGAELMLSNLWMSIGIGALWNVTSLEPPTSIGFRVRTLDFTGVGLGYDLLPLAFRLNLATRRV